MTEFEENCYGITTEEIKEQYMNSITAKHCGLEMVLKSILSDCQEMMSMCNPTVPSPNTNEYLRKKMNIAKFILCEMSDAKRVD